MQGNENNHTLLMGVQTTTHVRAQSLSCVSFFETHGLWPARLLRPWDSPGKSTRVGCHFLLQGIFPSHGSNPCLLHWQADSLPLSHQGRPQKLAKTTFKICLAVFLKTKPYNPAISLLSIYEEKRVPRLNKKIMHRRVHNSIAHNSQKTGNNPNVPQQQNGKEDYSYNRVLTATKKTTNATCCRHTCSKEARHKSTSPEIPFTRSSSTGKTLLW